jgi:DNA-binding MarR family transcriptional regulator
MEDRAQSSLVALRRILRATEENTRRIARATGLTAPQLAVMQIVAEAGEIAPSMIARRAGIAPPTATALIEKLDRRGLLSRRRSETDRRSLRVALTEAGRAALEQAPDPLHARFSERFAEIPAWEQAMIVAALERVAALVTGEERPPAGGGDAPILHHVGDPSSEIRPEPPPEKRRARHG